MDIKLQRKDVLVLWGQRLNQLQDRMASDIAPFDLTTQQFNVLRILRGALPEILCAKVVRERLVDKNADVSRMLGRLEEKGLILLKPSQLDGRQKDVELSELGKERLAKIDEACPNIPYSYLDSLEYEELETFKQLLNKLEI